jgi:hypothetical protein
MNNARETIYAALFALAEGAADFVTASRRTRLINEVQPSQLPALYMQQIGETVAAQRFAPAKYTLRVDLAIYAQNPDPSQSAAPLVNSLIDAVEAALAPPVPGQPQTLGGLVSDCVIAGEITLFDGALGNRSGAVIPVEIVTT